MKQKIKSIRPFVGAKNFEESRAFYRDLGFEETVLEHNFSVFKKDDIAFYLQDYYAKEWIENTMIFIEVEDTEEYYLELSALNLPQKYPSAKLSPVKTMDWGKECFLHDPSGILWHFGEFFDK
ncbi:glyoxalase [Chryseobacterium sp. 09-1422]|jgi:catechol 2,3-dioxygenase-like lactoylglutathione lyase family enzyme|uniref:Glyoxalase n=1 Tax=Chryseobacterium kimseyorum TaxID=2984028 RepID=A0ABT3HTQ3_9FLAO|nr:glyoxalase [Chryseobacterium kimseyorum]MCW3167178.1 glyoxalase [Chryseobacterium kimseyorum]